MGYSGFLAYFVVYFACSLRVFFCFLVDFLQVSIASLEFLFAYIYFSVHSVVVVWAPWSLPMLSPIGLFDSVCLFSAA